MRLGSLKSVSLTSEREWEWEGGRGQGGYEPGDGFAAIIVRQSSGPAMTESLILVSRHVWVDANLTLSRTPARSAGGGGRWGIGVRISSNPLLSLKKKTRPTRPTFLQKEKRNLGPRSTGATSRLL